jgi:hypothetical protein
MRAGTSIKQMERTSKLPGHTDERENKFYYYLRQQQG